MSMERAKFKERMKALKAYKDETGKGYWDWKVQAFDDGGYTIQAGDSLSAIAKRNNISLSDLLELNPQIKNPDLIYKGDVINIGQKEKITQTPTAFSVKNNKPAQEEVQIQNEPSPVYNTTDSFFYSSNVLNYDEQTNSWNGGRIYHVPEPVITGKSSLKSLPKSNLAKNSYLENEYDAEVIAKAKSGSAEEIRLLQQELAEQGYYDIQTYGMSPNQIKELQRKVGTKDDGIWGKNSKAANRKYQITGTWNEDTERAFIRSMSASSENWSDEVSTEDTEWCAEWVGKKVNASVGDRWSIGIHGDAWKMPQNIARNGGEMIYNVYDDPSFKEETTAKNLRAKTEKALKENQFDISQLQVGDIVGIYMPSSNMHSRALREGTTYNTHVGVVTGYDDKGVPIIEHNIHRGHHKDPANKLTGSLFGRPKIATVSRPAYDSLRKPFDIPNGKSIYTKEGDSPLFVEYANSVEGSKDLIRKLFPEIDVDEVERITLAVQGRETGFMKNKESDQTGIDALKVKAKHYAREHVSGFKKSREQWSSNLAKTKLSSFTGPERRMFSLNAPEDLEDPKKAGAAAMYLLAKNYDYFKRLQSSYPQLGITDADISYLTELSFNQGMNKLNHIGFDPKTGAIAPEELETIRYLADPNTRIKDVNSTHYSHLGALGEFIYNLTEDGYVPYIAAAENYKKMLMEVADKNKSNLVAQANVSSYKNGGMVPAYTDGTNRGGDVEEELVEETTPNLVQHLLSFGPYKGKTYADVQEQMRTNDPESYDRLQTNIARAEQPTSEIVFYKDADGNQQKAINLPHNQQDAVAEFLPGTGDVAELMEIGNQVKDGNYGTAAAMVGLAFLPGNLNALWKSGKKAMQNGAQTLSNALDPVFTAMEKHSANGRFVAGFANDVLLQPNKTFKALREGTYPTSYAKVSQQVRKLHEDLLDSRVTHYAMSLDDLGRYTQVRKDRLKDELTNATNFYEIDGINQALQYIEDNVGRQEKLLDDIFINFPQYITGRSYYNHRQIPSSLGFNDGKKAVTKARHHTNFINEKDIIGTNVHERQHQINSTLNHYDVLTQYNPDAGYYTVSGADGDVQDVFKFQNASVQDVDKYGNYTYGTWQSSPDEFLAELANYRVTLADGKTYSKMSASEKEAVAEKMTERFYNPMTAFYPEKSKDELIITMMDKLKTLDVFGYSDGGIVGKKKLKRSLKNKQKNKSN